MHIMGALAEFERSLIIERTQAGIQAAKKRGVRLGRRPTLAPSQVDHARALIERGESPRAVARTMRVGKSTLYRALKTTDWQSTTTLVAQPETLPEQDTVAEAGGKDRGRRQFDGGSTAGHGTVMEPRRLEPLNPMLSAPNRRFALTPVAKPGASPTHDTTCMQSKDLCAAAARSADQLQENPARAHANADDANLGRDGRGIVCLKRHRDTRHLERQSP
jgi:Resolvase, N terminal domain/Helix-turn-helix domain of resolvase